MVRASGFKEGHSKYGQCLDAIQILDHSTHRQVLPFEYRTSPVFGSLLYNLLNLQQLTRLAIEVCVCVCVCGYNLFSVDLYWWN